MEGQVEEPHTIDRSSQSSSFGRRQLATQVRFCAVPSDFRVHALVPRRYAPDAGDLDQEGERHDWCPLDMDWLGGIVCEDLIDIFQWTPDALGDGEEHGNLLRSPKEVVQSAAGEGEVDGGRDGGTIAEDLLSSVVIHRVQ